MSAATNVLAIAWPGCTFILRGITEHGASIDEASIDFINVRLLMRQKQRRRRLSSEGAPSAHTGRHVLVLSEGARDEFPNDSIDLSRSGVADIATRVDVY
jgi:hypothetical protein